MCTKGGSREFWYRDAAVSAAVVLVTRRVLYKKHKFCTMSMIFPPCGWCGSGACYKACAKREAEKNLLKDFLVIFLFLLREEPGFGATVVPVTRCAFECF